MTDTSKLELLLKLLDEAEKLAKEFSGGYSNNFSSAQEFHAALADSIAKLKTGDNDQLNYFCLWFAPTCDWDDLIRQDGEDLANKIYPLSAELRKSLMVYSITDLIIDYQQSVERVMAAFGKEFNRTDLLTAWKSDKILQQKGQLTKYHIKRYTFHGIGLAVDFDDNTSVDFDFAFFPEQRHDGFDLHKLGEFVSTRPNKYKKYLDRKKLEADFNKQVERGVIVNPNLIFSTTLYFFKSSLPTPQKVEAIKKKSWWKFW
jgi:hypothetical protein